jgi:glutamine amidotransferase
LISTADTVVIDLGSGNLRSVEKAVEHAARLADCRTARVLRTSDPDVIRRADRVILPGQGAFGKNARALGDGTGEAVLERLRAGVPFFGICIGLQLLFESSQEAPGVPGLGWFRGKVQRLVGGADLKIPHMGWNSLELREPAHPLLGAAHAAGEYFYFVHSYHAVADDRGVLLATAEYGPNCVTAVVGRDNVFATQFHPEKSQRAGLALLREFFKQ